MGKKRKSKAIVPRGERVLTLDVASASGFAYGAGGVLVTYGKYSDDKTADLGARLYRFSKWVAKVLNDLPEAPEKVVVEAPYYGFNVKTFSVLSKYVAIVQREVFRVLGIECEFISPSDVKKRLGLKGSRNHAQNKRAMVNKINDLLGLDLQYVAGRKTKSKASSDDIADAIGLLLAYWIKHGVYAMEENG